MRTARARLTLPSFRWAICLLAAALVTFGASAPTLAQSHVGQSPLAPSPGPQQVLLTNGNVLSGEVGLIDGKYQVVIEGGELHLPQSSVAHVAPSRVELYEWQRDQSRRGTLVDRLRLAEWCIKQQLWPQAAQELQEIRLTDPNDRRLAVADRRLSEAWKRATAAPTPDAEPSRIDARLAESARAAEELGRIDELPDGTVEQFTRRVQPILVNNCTASGCHAPGGASSFQLNRDCLHGLADRRSTFANLASVLAAIDRENPAASPLLSAAIEPHGGMATGPLTGRRATLADALSQWVRHATTPNELIAAATPAARARPLYSGLIGGGFRPALPSGYGRAYPQATRAAELTPQTAVADPDVRPAAFDQPLGDQPLGNQPMGDEEYAPLTTETPRRGAQLKKVAPRDEFDPEIFNRQFRSETR